MKYKRNARTLAASFGKAHNVIGLTGGIGSGKTVATDALRGAGFTVIDADEISRELFAADTIGEKTLIAAFPQAQKNGRLDRAALRKLISEDGSERQKLNECTHGAITAEIKRRIAETAPPVVLSAPLLFETALAGLCDQTVCIYCPRDIRIRRISERDGITEESAWRMIEAQIPDTERATLSDYIVPSDVPVKDFTEEVVELFKAICNVSMPK